MTEGKPSKLIFRFALPLLAGNVLQQMYNLVDSVVVGNFVGKEALAAVGNSFVINFLMTSLFMGIGLGATILISQFFGAGKNDGVKATVDTMYVAMVIGAAVVTVIGLVSARPLLVLMNTPDGTTLDWSVSYLQIMFVGTVASFGYNINSGILQGIGDSKSSLLFLAVATVLNIILDLLFVAVFGWGVAGVALATILAQFFSFVFGIWFINHRIRVIRISLRKFDFSSDILIKCIKIGLPAGVQNVLFSLGTIVLQRLVNRYGPGFMAGYSATGKIDSFAFMPIASFATAVTTYVGQNVGARRLDRVKQGVRSTLLMSFVLCVFVSAFVLIFGRYLLMAFSQDEEVIVTGLHFLHRLMPLYFLLSVLFVVNAALRGAGQSVLPLVSAIVSLLAARVPSAYLLDYLFGKYEMFWCFGIGWACGLLISVPYYVSGKWKKKALTGAEGL